MFVLLIGRASRLRFAVARRLLLLGLTANPSQRRSSRVAMRKSWKSRNTPRDTSRAPSRAFVAPPRTRVNPCAATLQALFNLVPFAKGGRALDPSGRCRARPAPDRPSSARGEYL